jgi:hypothetical protein
VGGVGAARGGMGALPLFLFVGALCCRAVRDGEREQGEEGEGEKEEREKKKKKKEKKKKIMKKFSDLKISEK